MRINLYVATCSLLAYYGATVSIETVDDAMHFADQMGGLDYELAEVETFSPPAPPKGMGIGKEAQKDMAEKAMASIVKETNKEAKQN